RSHGHRNDHRLPAAVALRAGCLARRRKAEGGDMKENRVKRILGEGSLALGTHVGGIADPQIVELIGLAGFDAAFIDMEHTSFDLQDVLLAVINSVRVCVIPIVLPQCIEPVYILSILVMTVAVKWVNLV